MSIRRGLSLIELTVAMIVLGVALAAVAKIATTAARQRREMRHRQVATQEAANVLERVAALPWRRLEDPQFRQGNLSPIAADVLPGGELKVGVDNVAGPPEGRRIRVTVTWKNAAGETVPGVRLVGWSFRNREAGP